MKKLYILITLLLFLPLNIYASTKTYERTEDNNYGVNKKWEINSSNINNVLNSKKVDSSEKIYDFADILTDDEEKKLYEKIMNFIYKYKTDFVILTDDIPYTYDKVNEDYAVDFYDYNDFGIDFDKYSGIILFRNNYEEDRYYDMYLFGDSQLYFDQYRKDESLDGIYYYLSNKIYLNGFSKFIDYCDKYYSNGIPNDLKAYYVDDYGYLHFDSNYKEPYKAPIIGILIIDIIVTLIVMLVLISKNRMVKTKLNIIEYFDKKSLNFTKNDVKFVRSYVTSHTHESSSSGGGGGSYHSSGGSSGGGHSSGGGRHG